MTLVRLRLTGLVAAVFASTLTWAHSSMDLTARVALPPFLRAGVTERIEVGGDIHAFDPAPGVNLTIETDTGTFTNVSAPSTWRCTRTAKRITCAADEAAAGPHRMLVDLATPSSGSVSVSVTIESIFSTDPEPFDNRITNTSRVYAPASCGTAAPAQLSAAQSRGGVDLSWSAVPGAASYDVFASLDGETPRRLTTTGSTHATARFAGGGNVTWFVRANFDGCPSTDSGSASFDHPAAAPRLTVSSTTSSRLTEPVSVAVHGDSVVIGDAGQRALRSYHIATGAVFELPLTGEVDTPPLALDGGVTAGPGGYLYIADRANHLIRFVYPDSRAIFPVAGTSGSAGASDGLGKAARVSSPMGIVSDGSSRVYVADSGNDTIRRMFFDAPKGEFAMTTLVPASAGLDDPAGIAIDAEGNLYVADRGNHVIRRVTPSGAMTTIAGVLDTAGHRDGDAAQALFDRPFGIGVDPWGNVLVTEEGNHTVRRIAPNGTVTTVAGSPGQAGNADGVGEAARFNRPAFLAIDEDGVVWIADRGNAALRRAQFTVPAPKRRSSRH
jgi:sugar lactone lactonase YvrE